MAYARWRVGALAGAVWLWGCASGSQRADDNAGPSPQAVLEVDNRSVSDMDIFVVRTGQRIRLGLAPGSEVTRFGLPTSLITAAGFARFEAVPLTGPGEAARTEPVKVTPGDTVRLSVPPP